MNVSCNVTHCLYSKIHMHRETDKTVYFGKLVNPNDGYHVSKQSLVHVLAFSHGRF